MFNIYFMVVNLYWHGGCYIHKENPITFLDLITSVILLISKFCGTNHTILLVTLSTSVAGDMMYQHSLLKVPYYTKNWANTMKNKSNVYIFYMFYVYVYILFIHKVLKVMSLHYIPISNNVPTDLSLVRSSKNGLNIHK